ncbi:ankyrin repeat domain-containing protein [Candidatus Babela massiliensis]|uniref:Ankyrin repeats containing protein n=1 Tax=Candidatus Babela massiliensis TaxID=673862 RepID=V6DFE1_9BACT|nr:ankyrin repeat domain-containing protein [Candidatus Babela massiliensis]CDK30269.1 Ankyrin repeats containing protein [Candidatus Babela massiliensis]
MRFIYILYVLIIFNIFFINFIYSMESLDTVNTGINFEHKKDEFIKILMLNIIKFLNKNQNIFQSYDNIIKYLTKVCLIDDDFRRISKSKDVNRVIRQYLAPDKIDLNQEDLNRNLKSILNKYDLMKYDNKEEFSEINLAKLVISGANVNVKSDQGTNILILSSEKNYENLLNLLLKYTAVDINAIDVFGFTALSQAYEYGYDNIVKVIMKDPKLDIKKAFLNAAKHDQSLLEFLLESTNFDINAKDQDGNTALMLAVMYSNTNSVNVLLNYYNKKLEDINVKNNNGDTVLMIAIRYNNIDIIKRILEESTIDINVKNNENISPLILAIRLGNEELSGELLKDKRTDVNIKDDYGNTPLILASDQGEKNIVKVLINNPDTDIDIANDEGYTALYYARRNGHKVIVKWLEDKIKI